MDGQNSGAVETAKPESPQKPDIIAKVGGAIVFAFKNIVDFIKSRFQKEQLKFTIPILSVIALIIAASVYLLIINPQDHQPEAEFSVEEWKTELNSIGHEATNILSDKAMNDYYEDKINSTDSIYKKVDLTIYFAQEIIRRGYVSQGVGKLDEININDMTCVQEIDYYEAYRRGHIMLGNDYQVEKYDQTISDVYERCPEALTVEGENE